MNNKIKNFQTQGCFKTEDCIETMYQTLLNELAQKYISELTDLMKQQQNYIDYLKKYESDARDILRDSGMLLDRFEELEKRDQDRLKIYLKKIYKKFLERPSRRVHDVKMKSLHNSLAISEGSKVLTPYSSDIFFPLPEMASEMVEHIKINDNWIRPLNPEEINIKIKSEGSGTGWGDSDPPTPIEYILSYFFIPDKTTSWKLIAYFFTHGFYIVRANDGCSTKKEAGIRMALKMNVFQPHGLGDQWKMLIDEHGKNIEIVKLYEKPVNIDYIAMLQANKPVAVNVTIALWANADGSGSHAEINFKDGPANYILPGVLTATPM